MSTGVTPSLAEIRAGAQQHAAELEERRAYLSVAQVAARIQMSETYVRDIPRADLPYVEFGHGLKLRRRRYRPADVDAYLDGEFARQNARARRAS